MALPTETAATILASQTKVNGAKADYRFSIGTNSIWRYRDRKNLWRDGVGAFILVDGRPEREDTRAVARKNVSAQASDTRDLELIYDYSFVVSDDVRSYTIAVHDPDPRSDRRDSPAAGGHILTFTDAVPPAGTDLVVVNPVIRNNPAAAHTDPRAQIICFTSGSWIRTPVGPKPVEQMVVDDLVLTKDNGVRPVRWVGRRRMTGARLLAMPGMRPVRIRRGALGNNLPDRDLTVSPRHRVLLKGAVANELFNTPEVLVTAQDLINGRTVTVDFQVRQTEYIHLMFDQHDIIWANGVETESFHPGHTRPTAVPGDQLQEMYRIFPELKIDPHYFGPAVRRMLSPHEAAAFLHA